MAVGVEDAHWLVGKLADDKPDLPDAVACIEEHSRLRADDEIRDDLLPLERLINCPNIGRHLVDLEPVIAYMVFLEVRIGWAWKPVTESLDF